MRIEVKIFSNETVESHPVACFFANDSDVNVLKHIILKALSVNDNVWQNLFMELALNCSCEPEAYVDHVIKVYVNDKIVRVHESRQQMRKVEGTMLPYWVAGNPVEKCHVTEMDYDTVTEFEKAGKRFPIVKSEEKVIIGKFKYTSKKYEVKK